MKIDWLQYCFIEVYSMDCDWWEVIFDLINGLVLNGRQVIIV